MFTKFFARLFAPIANALAAAILKSDTGKEWLGQAIADRVSVKAVAQHLDYGALYDQIDTSDMYEEIGKRCGVTASDIAEHLDTDEIARNVELDYYDLYQHIELSELAGNIDLSDLAREIEIDADDVTVDYESLDYESLAKALIKELAKPKAEVRSSAS
jgi:hypothetical protein